MHEQIAGAECHREVNLSEPHDDKEEMLMFHNSHDLNFAPFFCAYIRRSALDESAGLDAQYGRHYRSDRIMCDFVRHVLGRKIVYVAAAVVYHSLQSSTEELRCDESRQKEFDEICNKNRWPEELGAALGYGVPIWDRS